MRDLLILYGLVLRTASSGIQMSGFRSSAVLSCVNWDKLCFSALVNSSLKSGLPFLSPRDLPDPWIKCSSPAWQAGSLPLSNIGSPGWGYLTSRTPSSSLASVNGSEFGLTPDFSLWIGIRMWKKCLVEKLDFCKDCYGLCAIAFHLSKKENKEWSLFTLI